MGGRLDATNNVVAPMVSVITPIALDHTQWLGETLAEVAREKAGIIKPGVPVVSARQEAAAAQVLREAASETEFVENPLEAREVALLGSFQKRNAALAVAALRAGGWETDDAAIREGLRNARCPGRFQIVGERFVLDGVDNPHAITNLAQNWRENFGDERADVIFGALADKDHQTMLKILEPIAREFLFVPVRNERRAAPEALAAGWAGRGRVFEALQPRWKQPRRAPSSQARCFWSGRP